RVHPRVQDLYSYVESRAREARGPPLSQRFSSVILILFSAVVAGALIYIFYATELRTRIEDKLFDLRTRLSPDLVATDEVLVVEIDQESIAALDGQDAKDLSYAALERLVTVILDGSPRHVAVFLPPQIFS